MYAVFSTGHLVFVALLLILSAALFKRSFMIPKPRLNPGKKMVYFTLRWGIVICFGVLVLAQAELQFGGDAKISEIRTVYDNREWYIESKFQKGGIFDRSGLPERALALSKPSESGIYQRVYPLGGASGHLVGYSNRKRGRAGIEAVFMPNLIGASAGHIENWLGSFIHRVSSPEPRGNNVFLTIDSRLQKVCYDALGGRAGAAVILDPHSGEVLALSSSPGFSPNDAVSDTSWFSLLGRDEDAPLFNRALQGLYPPGSIFKIITAAAALERGLDPVIRSGPGGFIPGGSGNPVREHEYNEYTARGLKWTGHGKLNMTKAFIKSSNVYFAQLGCRLGAQSLKETAEKFGLNTGILWNTASKGLQAWFNIRRSYFPDARSMSTEALSWSAIGQYKVLVSPIQMALAAAAIANGGNLVRPSLELGRYPKSAGRVISVKTAEKMRQMMRDAVEKGTGYLADVKDISVAGKTGTAEINAGRPHSWFVSFAPYENPRMVVVAVVEHGGYGGDAAAEVVRKIYVTAKKYDYFK